MRADDQPRRRPLLDDQVDLVVEGFRMLADGTQVRILWALIGGELSAQRADPAQETGQGAPADRRMTAPHPARRDAALLSRGAVGRHDLGPGARDGPSLDDVAATVVA